MRSEVVENCTRSMNRKLKGRLDCALRDVKKLSHYVKAQDERAEGTKSLILCDY